MLPLALLEVLVVQEAQDHLDLLEVLVLLEVLDHLD
jgi:hypothetical protein